MQTILRLKEGGIWIRKPIAQNISGPSLNWGIRWLEDDLAWKETLDGRQPWMEGNFGWKTTLDGR